MFAPVIAKLHCLLVSLDDFSWPYAYSRSTLISTMVRFVLSLFRLTFDLPYLACVVFTLVSCRLIFLNPVQFLLSCLSSWLLLPVIQNSDLLHFVFLLSGFRCSDLHTLAEWPFFVDMAYWFSGWTFMIRIPTWCNAISAVSFFSVCLSVLFCISCKCFFVYSFFFDFFFSVRY